MTPSLTSNYFLVTSTPRPRLTRNHRPISAKAPQNSSPFNFDLVKLPDVKSLVPAVANPSTGLGLNLQRRKDPGTVFVAGATGQAGTRIVQTLLRQGFSVRAGVPDLGAAQELAYLAAQYRIISSDESRRLNAVDSTFDDAKSIAKAIGNAAKVVVTIGPAENGPNSQVSPSDALQVVQAAQLAKVDHMAIVFNEEIASTNNVLDGITSFFSNIFSKSQPLTKLEFLQKLMETDIGYTFIKTKLTEDFSLESSYSLVVSPEGSAGGSDYKVTRSQIASLVAQVFSNTAVAENKVVEVFTDPSAPSKPMDELFRGIPEDSRRKVYAESVANARTEEEARQAPEQEAGGINLAAEAQKRAEAAGASVEKLLNKTKSISLGGISWVGSGVGKGSDSDSEGSRVEVATVRGQAKARSLPSLKAITKKKSNSSASVSKQPEPSKETRNVFGGWFKQETIYVDDD